MVSEYLQIEFVVPVNFSYQGKWLGLVWKRVLVVTTLYDAHFIIQFVQGILCCFHSYN